MCSRMTAGRLNAIVVEWRVSKQIQEEQDRTHSVSVYHRLKSEIDGRGLNERERQERWGLLAGILEYHPLVPLAGLLYLASWQLNHTGS